MSNPAVHSITQSDSSSAMAVSLPCIAIQAPAGAIARHQPRNRWDAAVNRLVYEYTNTEASATGDRTSASRLSRHAASTNKADDMHVNIQTNRASTSPDGSARPAVRGLAASIRRSAILLNAIAAELDPTIASVIQIFFFSLHHS